MTKPDPIEDAETLSEQPQSIDAPSEPEEGPTATIVYAGGVEEVSGFTKLEELMDAGEPYPDMADEAQIQVLRVWYDDEYVDYDYGTLVKVEP